MCVYVYTCSLPKRTHSGKPQYLLFIHSSTTTPFKSCCMINFVTLILIFIDISGICVLEAIKIVRANHEGYLLLSGLMSLKC